MVPTTEVKFEDIKTPGSMMMRVKLDLKTVAKYAKAMKAGAQFPPIIIYEVDGQMILVDGYHRHKAYSLCGVETIQADLQMGRTIDDAILAAVREDAHEGLPRTDADKEKAVKALLASEKWRGMSDGEIGRAAGVAQSYVHKLRKVANQLISKISSTAPSRETRLGKDGKRRPATRTKPKPAEPQSSPSVSAPTSSAPPLKKFTWQELGAPAPGTEHEQDPDSPQGVTRAMAWSAKHGHVQLMPVDQKMREQRERKVTSFIAALRDLGKQADTLMQSALGPAEFMATLQGMKGAATSTKFDERMTAIEPMLTTLTALNAMRSKKNAA